MVFVIDASIAGSLVMPDEFNDISLSVMELLKDEDAAVPMIFWYEIENLLLVAEKRKRITLEQALSALKKIKSLPILLASIDRDLFEIARNNGVSVYDAAYLDLAMSQNYALWTLDRKLAHAARQNAITVKPEIIN